MIPAHRPVGHKQLWIWREWCVPAPAPRCHTRTACSRGWASCARLSSILTRSFCCRRGGAETQAPGTRTSVGSSRGLYRSGTQVENTADLLLVPPALQRVTPTGHQRTRLCALGTGSLCASLLCGLPVLSGPPPLVGDGPGQRARDMGVLR